MKKNKKNRQKSTSPKTNIIDLKNSRDGGQIALRGYSYQFLYSCYLILSSGRDAQFQLEGIEDVDCIKQKDGNSSVTHIQLKYSVNKQDASFLPDVLKNFLETYLLDQNRFFKLVYDFPVAKGHLSKLFDSNLDDKSRAYWTDVISKIRQNNPYWNWAAYDFNKFISRLSFEKIEKATLAAEIEKALIAAYEITTDNISLFTNSIKILCFEKMEQRAYVNKDELDIQRAREYRKAPLFHIKGKVIQYYFIATVNSQSFYFNGSHTITTSITPTAAERAALEALILFSRYWVRTPQPKSRDIIDRLSWSSNVNI